MKSLVLLYKDKERDTDLCIKIYTQIKDKRNVYVLGKNWYGNDYGVRKDYVGKVTSTKNYPITYPVELPLRCSSWHDDIFMFVNKDKYDQDPIYYQNMILQYKE